MYLVSELLSSVLPPGEIAMPTTPTKLLLGRSPFYFHYSNRSSTLVFDGKKESIISVMVRSQLQAKERLMYCRRSFNTISRSWEPKITRVEGKGTGDYERVIPTKKRQDASHHHHSNDSKNSGWTYYLR